MINSRFGKLWLGFLEIVCFVMLLFLGFRFLSKFLPPERIIVIGKVTDVEGKPLSNVQVHAVPVPVLVVEEPPKKDSDGRNFKTITDKDGFYRLKGLAGRCGWKESSYIQPYNITFELAGYEQKLINFQKPERAEDNTISGVDIILEKKANTAISEL